jgi:hypothetical protein
MTYIPPSANSLKFTCPHCQAIANQSWMSRDEDFAGGNTIRRSKCDHCNKYCLWHTTTMVYPDRGMAPPANSDMPVAVKKFYTEAASIAGKSPRAAAGLLRLALQVLCGELSGGGKNINNDIATLVQKGLPVLVQQSLDVVRVTGNNAVHPGQIDTDDAEVVNTLFTLLNVIVEYMITLPNQVGALYKGLPPGALEQIAKRDAPKH